MQVKELTAAIDICSTGVVTLLCLLSNRFPFFDESDDLTVLAQLESIYGVEHMNESFKDPPVQKKIHTRLPNEHKEWSVICKA